MYAYKYNKVCTNCKREFLTIKGNKKKCSMCQTHTFSILVCKECGQYCGDKDYCSLDCEGSFTTRMLACPKVKKELDELDLAIDLKIAQLSRVLELIKSGMNPFKAEAKIMGTKFNKLILN